MTDTPIPCPPFGTLFGSSDAGGAVGTAVRTFATGALALYDTHPHHAALIAGCSQTAAPVNEGDTPEMTLDRLLVSSAFRRRFGSPTFTDETWAALIGIRHGPLLRRLLDQDDPGEVEATVRAVVERPWAVHGLVPPPVGRQRPLTAFEPAVCELLAPAATAWAVGLVRAIDVETAAADIAVTLMLAEHEGRADRVAEQLVWIMADARIAATWRSYRGPALFIFEHVALGGHLDKDDVDLVARLFEIETALKFVPALETKGRFELAESYVAQPDAVRLELRRIWARVPGETESFRDVRRRHRALCAPEVA